MDLQPRDFEVVGANYLPTDTKRKVVKKSLIQSVRERPYISAGILLVIILGCLFAEVIMTYDPTYMDLVNSNTPRNEVFYFGTDAMGRDIFSMIWYGGRISLFIGILATVISTGIAVLYGSVSGVASEGIDSLMMRTSEMILSIPSILIIIFMQAMIGESNPVSIAIVIGLTSWMNIAKVVRSEVRQMRNSEHILAARYMGGGFFYIMKWHMLPYFVPSIMFMVVTNIGTAIGTESTLSFLGIGLPLEIISWGSMLSQADRALLSNDWWIILIPGIFLVVTLVCITDIGNYMRKRHDKRSSYL